VIARLRSFMAVHDDRLSGPGGLPPDRPLRVALWYVQRTSKASTSAATRRSEMRPTQCSIRLMLAQREVSERDGHRSPYSAAK
jgi:hypothetical protein